MPGVANAPYPLEMPPPVSPGQRAALVHGGTTPPWLQSPQVSSLQLATSYPFLILFSESGENFPKVDEWQTYTKTGKPMALLVPRKTRALLAPEAGHCVPQMHEA